MNSAAAIKHIKTIQKAFQVIATLQLTAYMYPEHAAVQNGAAFDYIVVGAGSAGSVIATRLAQDTNTSVLLIEAGGDPPIECAKVYPNSPCPLFGKSHRVIIKERNTFAPRMVVRICEAPVDVKVDTSYLRYADMALKLGAMKSVKGRCLFCRCGACCPCTNHEYEPRDADRTATRRTDMRTFDARVKTVCTTRVMYN